MALDRIGDGLALRSKGDIVSYDGTSAYVLPSSSSGQVIQASSTSPSGVVWATANTAPVEAWVPIGIAQATATTSELTISNIPSGYEKLVAILALRRANNVTYYNFTPSGEKAAGTAPWNYRTHQLQAHLGQQYTVLRILNLLDMDKPIKIKLGDT